MPHCCSTKDVTQVRKRPSLDQNQVTILDQKGTNDPLYSSWSCLLTSPPVFIEDYDLEWMPTTACGLLVTAQHYKEPEVSIVRRAFENGVPTLILADGILEYRNTWIHPDMAPGSIFQPVVGHKIACLGRSQARILESWGNVGKCEIVGAPRFDRLIGKQPRQRKEDEAFRFLVTTARMPGFTPQQMGLVKRSLQDLKFWASQHRQINGLWIELVWRLTQDLDTQIGVPNQLTQRSGQELAEILNTVDAVITTPSTTMLEAKLNGLPVALLDYNNCPHYVPAAWTISAPRHLDQVLPELVDPPPAKMLYQDTVLHDALECRSPAAPRMVRLVEEMISIAHDCRERNEPVVFPPHILTDHQHGYHLPEERFDMRALYPDHPVFADMDRATLQVRIEQLKNEQKRLRGIIKADNFVKEILKSFPGPRKLLRLWRESRRKPVHEQS